VKALSSSPSTTKKKELRMNKWMITEIILKGGKFS
jgi:hypothetical protein